MTAAAPEQNVIGSVVKDAEKMLLGDLEEGLKQALAELEKEQRETTVSLARQIAEAKKRAAAVKAQKAGSAELFAKHASLELLEETTKLVFQEVLTRARSARGEAGYTKNLIGLLEEALDAIGANEVAVQGRADDRRLLEDVAKTVAASKKVVVKVDPKPIKCHGGVIVSTPDGSMHYDNTFEARLERFRPALRKRIAEILLK